MALTDKLSAIGTAIRNKTGKTELMTLDEMPTEIAGISTGGDIPESALNFTSMENIDYNGNWDWFFTQYKSQITTSNISEFSQAFYNSKVTDLSGLVINMEPYTTGVPTQRMNSAFALSKIETLPQINNLQPGNVANCFQNCQNLTAVNIVINWNAANAQDQPGWSDAASLFDGCYKLKTIDPSWFNRSTINWNSSTIYYYGFRDCSSLVSITDLGVENPASKSQSAVYDNMFEKTFEKCYKLRKLTFKLNDDGTAIAANWANQIINVYELGWAKAGYPDSIYEIMGWDFSKKITNQEQFNSLKDDPEAWTTNNEYSLYTHDRVVETLNTLPDTHVYLTEYKQNQADASNTIQFWLADRNRPNEAEIAVATAKGWTVTFA